MEPDFAGMADEITNAPITPVSISTFSVGSDRFNQAVDDITRNLVANPKRLFNYPLLEFFTGSALGYGTKQVVRNGLMRVMGGVEEVTPSLGQAVRTSDQEAEVVKRKLFNTQTPDSKHRLAFSVARGAAFGALSLALKAEMRLVA